MLMSDVFFSLRNRPKSIPVDLGDGTDPVYEKQLVNGVSTLVEVGRTSLFDFVQASKDDTLIYNILSRYERGDESALNRVGGVYADVVGMPTNLAEAKASIIRFENMFENLSSEDKEKFNNNVNEFLMAIATADTSIEMPNVVDKVESDGDVVEK